MTIVTLTTSHKVQTFLKENGIPEEDSEEVWICPICGVKNFGIYFSHERPCECGKFSHPKVTGESRESIAKMIGKYLSEIQDNENKIDQLEGENCYMEEEIRKLKFLLSPKEKVKK